jgi:hypothetical protein
MPVVHANRERSVKARVEYRAKARVELFPVLPPYAVRHEPVEVKAERGGLLDNAGEEGDLKERLPAGEADAVDTDVGAAAEKGDRVLGRELGFRGKGAPARDAAMAAREIAAIRRREDDLARGKRRTHG